MVQVVPRGQLLQLCLYGGNQLFVFGDPRKVCLVVQDFAETFRKVLRWIEEISECFSGFIHSFIIPHSPTIKFALGVKVNSRRLDISRPGLSMSKRIPGRKYDRFLPIATVA